jgi:hypothetical protein
MFTGVEPRTNRGIGSFDVIQPFIQPGRRRKETKDWGHLSLWFKMMPEMWCLQHVKVPKMEVIAVITRCLVNGHDSGTNWLEVPIPDIFLAYFLGLCKGIYPKNMVLYGTNVPPCIGSWRSPIEEMFCAFNMFQRRFLFFSVSGRPFSKWCPTTCHWNPYGSRSNPQMFPKVRLDEGIVWFLAYSENCFKAWKESIPSFCE